MGRVWLTDIKLELLAQLESASGGQFSGEIRQQWNKAQTKVAQDLPDCVLGTLNGTDTSTVTSVDYNSIWTVARHATELRVVSLEHEVHTLLTSVPVQILPAYGDVLAHRALAGTRWVSGKCSTVAAIEGESVKVGPTAIDDRIFKRMIVRPPDITSSEAASEVTLLPNDIVPLAEDYACYLALLQSKGSNANAAMTYRKNYETAGVGIYQKYNLEPPRAYVDRKVES
jgi:hypothetical protein